MNNRLPNTYFHFNAQERMLDATGGIDNAAILKT
jgi:hypothetical protein